MLCLGSLGIEGLWWTRTQLRSFHLRVRPSPHELKMHIKRRSNKYSTTQPHIVVARMAEVVRGHGGPPPKSLDSDENFKPEHTLFCRELKFVAIYALFGDLWAKKLPFWV